MDYSLLVMLLKDLVILPFQEIKLELKDDNSKKIIKLSSKKYDSRVLVVCPLHNNEGDASIDDLPVVGVVAYIKSKIELPNGNLRVTLRGEKRVKVVMYTSFTEDILSSLVTTVELPKLDETNEVVIKRKLREILLTYIDSSPNISNSIVKTINENEDLNFLTDAITTFLPLNVNQKLDYMREINASNRAINLINDINKEIKYNELEDKIDNEVQSKLTKDQEEFYLKEKLRMIEHALGTNDENEEICEYYEKLASLNLRKKTDLKIKHEIKRLEHSHQDSPERTVLKNYLDYILNLPWNTESKENLKVKSVLSILNKSHYGLTSIKERIIDYVNIKNINKNISNPVICLVGPPGVGKTTIASSIAKSLNREFYKISVGGLNDSTELIGNRRTYLGSLPGKIIQGLRKCGTNNPVILIDEVDKMVKDYKGDPASVLLDVLDNNQNKEFVDNYIEEPFDLSKVFFILTANTVESIPYTLYDRLEVIELSSYTEFEKLSISKKYILPRIYEEFNLQKKLTITDTLLKDIINKYTNEPGVRHLYRTLKTLVTKVVTGNKKSLIVTNKDIVKYLGNPIKTNEKIEINEYGVVSALAYTSLGGLTLNVECSVYEGKEDVIVSGSLGDILKESIKVSISYIKENNLVDIEQFKDKVIHIHLIAGATKKDGPSCGLSITTSIISRLNKKIVPSDISFTGELSLKGTILKIGGLKEKLIAAYNNGIKKVYIPLKNKNDLEDVPKEVLSKLDIKLVNNYKEIYNDLFK